MWVVYWMSDGNESLENRQMRGICDSFLALQRSLLERWEYLMLFVKVPHAVCFTWLDSHVRTSRNHIKVVCNMLFRLQHQRRIS